MSEEVKNKSEYLVEVRDLKQYFPIKTGFMKTTPLKAVDGVSFSIKPGETLGLVGESGCGKTTVGRSLLRLYTPTSGDVFFDGERVDEKSIGHMRKQMQMVFQDPYSSLNPRKHIYEILSQPMLYHGISNKETVHRDVDRLLDMVGLSKHVLGRYPHEFSGGQRQRICIARALALNPEFIVCDEPVSALDVSIQAQIINLLKELQEKRNLTYLFISHDLSVVEHISDTIGVMYLGGLVETGTTSDIFANPLHPYTEALFSAIPMPDPDLKRNRIILEGNIPSPANPPKGCKFHTRCRKCMEICKNQVPEVKDMGNGHKVRCHLYD